MAFWGCEFLFDGLPCSHYGLMVYDFGAEGQSDVGLGTGEMSEDWLATRSEVFSYGLVHNKSLEYTLVFGANMQSIDASDPPDRMDIEAIAAWLTGHSTRKWLTIVQDDMHAYRYKCYISELRLITHGQMPWAFSCRVSCDSPFAYAFPETHKFTVSGSTSVLLHNKSTGAEYFRPELTISTTGNSFQIINETDGGRVFAFAGLPSGSGVNIHVDNKNQIITNSLNENLYPYFNYNFLRLVRGANRLRLVGNGTVTFVCEFPVNIGG